MKQRLRQVVACAVASASFALASSPTYAGQPLMTTQLASSTATPGSTVDVYVFVQDVSEVRGYQTRISIQQTSGSGSVIVDCPLGSTDPNVRVELLRPDYIFYDVANVFSITNCLTRLTAAARLSGSTNVGTTPVYLATYTLTVSGDATPGSTFEIQVDPAPDSALADSLNQPIPFDVGEPSVLTIVRPENLVFETAFCSDCLQLGQPTTVQLRVFGLQEPINGVQALFAYDPDVLELTGALMGDGNGSPWEASTLVHLDQDEGDATLAVVMFGGSTQDDSIVATLFFDTVGPGTRSIDFREAPAPLATKLTTAAESATIIPNTVDSTEIIVGQKSKGDINGDGVRDGLDIQRFVEMVIDPEVATPEEFCAAELSGDGQVSFDADAELFVNCLINEICVCP